MQKKNCSRLSLLWFRGKQKMRNRCQNHWNRMKKKLIKRKIVNEFNRFNWSIIKIEAKNKEREKKKQQQQQQLRTQFAFNKLEMRLAFGSSYKMILFQKKKAIRRSNHIKIENHFRFAETKQQQSNYLLIHACFGRFILLFFSILC